MGDFDEAVELGARADMPTTQLEAAQFKRRQWREQHRKDDTSAPANVPYLHLPTSGAVDGEERGETREEVFGWRRLPRPAIKPGFLSNSLLTHTRGPDKHSSNTLNTPVFMMPISPVDACKYVPEEFTAVIESIFVPDAKKDMERSIATVERNIRREEELSRNLPTDDLLLFGEAKEFTSVDAYLARQLKEDQAAVADPKEEAREKAILAAKSSNIAQMEDALAEDIPINTADEFGNSLLILAAQQGSRRMVKFLLRRGANINLQSLAGNTPLHYCYAYSQHKLGDYLKEKVRDNHCHCWVCAVADPVSFSSGGGRLDHQRGRADVLRGAESREHAGGVRRQRGGGGLPRRERGRRGGQKRRRRQLLLLSCSQCHCCFSFAHDRFVCCVVYCAFVMNCVSIMQDSLRLIYTEINVQIQPITSRRRRKTGAHEYFEGHHLQGD